MNRFSVGLLSLALVTAAPLGAQERPIEIGVDGGLQIYLEDLPGDQKQLLFPSGFFRMGFYLTSRVALEPLVRFQRNWNDDYSLTVFQLQPNLAVYFREYERVAQPYVRGGMGIVHARVSGTNDDDSETQFTAVGGVGVKIPMLRHAFFRFEVNLEHSFEENPVFGEDVLGFMIGITAVIN
jgi:hypothetical protein